MPSSLDDAEFNEILEQIRLMEIEERFQALKRANESNRKSGASLSATTSQVPSAARPRLTYTKSDPSATTQCTAGADRLSCTRRASNDPSCFTGHHPHQCDTSRSQNQQLHPLSRNSYLPYGSNSGESSHRRTSLFNSTDTSAVATKLELKDILRHDEKKQQRRSSFEEDKSIAASFQRTLQYDIPRVKSLQLDPLSSRSCHRHDKDEPICSGERRRTSLPYGKEMSAAAAAATLELKDILCHEKKEQRRSLDRDESFARRLQSQFDTVCDDFSDEDVELPRSSARRRQPRRHSVVLTGSHRPSNKVLGIADCSRSFRATRPVESSSPTKAPARVLTMLPGGSVHSSSVHCEWCAHVLTATPSDNRTRNNGRTHYSNVNNAQVYCHNCGSVSAIQSSMARTA